MCLCLERERVERTPQIFILDHVTGILTYTGVLEKGSLYIGIGGMHSHGSMAWAWIKAYSI